MVASAFVARGRVQKYAWGLHGSNARVARLAHAAGAISSVDESDPYAELWFGTHATAPTSLQVGEEQVLLPEFLKANPALMGELPAKSTGELPFLFKVLSVRTALSIQAHPDKALAEKLHASNPAEYKDANHKPEMTIALTPFEALCGFRPLSETAQFMQEVPELVAAVGHEQSERLIKAASAGEGDERRAALKAAFCALMRQDAGVVKEQLQALLTRVSGSGESVSSIIALVQRLASQYPGDVGVFAAFFLNHLTLSPGQSIFLGPNIPHAYLSGECLECMATSDNVVRAGLTPKFRDVETMCEMLIFDPAPAVLIKPERESPAVTLHAPPGTQFPEFEVREVVLAESEAAAVTNSPGPRFVLVTEGSCTVSVMSGTGEQTKIQAAEGHCVFVAGDASLNLHKSVARCVAYVASCHGCMFPDDE